VIALGLESCALSVIAVLPRSATKALNRTHGRVQQNLCERRIVFHNQQNRVFR